ncbi:MAG: non-canonical purine NTP pyrophosphatase [Acidimicrobiales bacterium]|nr:MAG: non-canonical purine NTP pyrophosphatase [Acidimicrobiales bacterium]
MAITVLLATRNAKKLVELQRIINGFVGSSADIAVVTLDQVASYPEPVESGATFAENALIKAAEGASRTGLPTLADDSGLCVEALYGAPGVFSARWAGRHGDDQANLELLLAQLRDVPDSRRTAAFVCAAALVVPAAGGKQEDDPRNAGAGSAGTGSGGTDVEAVQHGRLTGELIRVPRGMGGFGYDPIFVPAGQQQTTAELTAEEKDAISHRGQAFRALMPNLAALVSSVAHN